MGKVYTTVQGDMWDSIAHTQLGSTKYTHLLMQANSHLISQYYLFPSGVELILPDIPQQSDAQGVSARLPWVNA